MESLLIKINSLGSFELNLLASVVFSILILTGRFLLRKAQEQGRLLINGATELYFYKYVSHHEIFNSEHIPKPMRQFFYVILTSLWWLIAALMVLAFVYGVKALTSKDWFLFIGHWFAFNYLLEALTWVRDSREDKAGKIIAQQKLEEIEATEKSS